jgi:hypothetical protein
VHALAFAHGWQALAQDSDGETSGRLRLRPVSP